MNKFQMAFAQANMLYDVEMDPDDLEEIGLIAWSKIGNKNYRLYRVRLDVDPFDLSVELPCNVDVIEAVTYDFEDWQYTSNVDINGDYNSNFTEEYIEARKRFQDPLYISGKYAHYSQLGQKLYFDKNYGHVNVLYKGVLVDEEGLPELNDKEVNAIACYIAYAQKFKEGYRQNNKDIIEIAQVLEQQWQKLCDAARVPQYINQNEMNRILDAKTSWNRKMFGKSFKPVK